MTGDPVLLITGASSGIGAQTARRAAEAGYRRVLGARQAEPLERLAGELGSPERAVTGMAESLRQMHENHGIRVTLIAPGMVDTDFYDKRPGTERALADDDVARACLCALSQPPSADVNEILLRPSAQASWRHRIPAPRPTNREKKMPSIAAPRLRSPPAPPSPSSPAAATRRRRTTTSTPSTR